MTPTEIDPSGTHRVGREVTSGYWSAKIGDKIYEDVAWAYDFPTSEVRAIAGLIAFYNEKVDVVVDGQLLERPKTHFVKQ